MQYSFRGKMPKCGVCRESILVEGHAAGACVAGLAALGV